MAKENKLGDEAATSARNAPKLVKKTGTLKNPSPFDRIRQKYKAEETVVEPSEPEAKITPPTQTTTEPMAVSNRLMRIATPAVDPPCSPKGYAGGNRPYDKVKEPWPDGQPTADEIIAWGNKVRDEGINTRNVLYTKDAIIYFSRYFWDINGPIYKQVKEIIQSAFE